MTETTLRVQEIEDEHMELPGTKPSRGGQQGRDKDVQLAPMGLCHIKELYSGYYGWSDHSLIS